MATCECCGNYYKSRNTRTFWTNVCVSCEETINRANARNKPPAEPTLAEIEAWRDTYYDDPNF
jgi:hypothetical protein